MYWSSDVCSSDLSACAGSRAGQSSRPCVACTGSSVRRTRQASASAWHASRRWSLSLSLPIALSRSQPAQQMQAGLDDVFFHRALRHAQQRRDLALLHVLQAEQDEDVAGARIQFVQHPEDLGQRLPRRYDRSEEHTSELQSIMRISYAVFCLKKKKKNHTISQHHHNK